MVYVWDIVGHILFSGVYIKLYIGDYSLFFSCNRTQCRGLGTNTCLYFDDCNLILVNHFVRAHRVGPCWAAAGAPVSSPLQLHSISIWSIVAKISASGVCKISIFFDTGAPAATPQGPTWWARTNDYLESNYNHQSTNRYLYPAPYIGYDYN